jgi:hypothetical protein
MDEILKNKGIYEIGERMMWEEQVIPEIREKENKNTENRRTRAR